MKLRVILGLLLVALPAMGQQSGQDDDRTLPKLGPKPPTTGTITPIPLTVNPGTTTAIPVNPNQLPAPSEWRTNSNTVSAVEGTVVPVPAATGTSKWDKVPAVKAPVLTLAPTTNLWQLQPAPTSKPVPSVATPPPSPWDSKSGKDIWK